MKTIKELGISPAPWTAEANALGEMVLTCHDTDADGKPWSEDFAQSWGATAEADAKAFCALPDLYDAARRANGHAQYRVRIGMLSKEGYRAAVEAEVRADVEERRRLIEDKNRPHCPYCGNISSLDMSGYCFTCRKTGLDSLHKETGRTNGWDRPPKEKVEVVGGWRGRPVAGHSIRGIRTEILEDL